MIFYLLRHGRSQANEAGLVTGTPTDVLVPEGFAQAVRMGKWLDEACLVAERHVTSQWERAQQTALSLVPTAEWQVDVRVGETDAGSVAGWRLTRLLSEGPDFYADPGNRYPGGESHRDMNERVLAWFREQLEDPCGALMLVSHSGPISCILQHVLGVGMERFPMLLPTHASLSIIEMRHGAAGWQGRLLGFSICPPLSMYTGDVRLQSGA